MTTRKTPATAALEKTVANACEEAHGDLVSRVMAGMDGLLEEKLAPVTDAQRTTGQALELLLKMANTDAEERAEFRRRLEDLEEWRGRFERAERERLASLPPAPGGA